MYSICSGAHFCYVNVFYYDRELSGGNRPNVEIEKVVCTVETPAGEAFLARRSDGVPAVDNRLLIPPSSDIPHIKSFTSAILVDSKRGRRIGEREAFPL
mmetsp:Transcript_27737/g.22942  ORF Transcript_27737/g.22942 Transcript_27737/m.22942 type:complete len:99 (+) Transcript_27737:140-436(+)